MKLRTQLAAAVAAILGGTAAHAQVAYVPCTTGSGAGGYCAQIQQPLPGETLQVWGNSAATIQQKFPATIIQAFGGNPNINAAFAALTPVEVGQLANEMLYHSVGNDYENWIITAVATLTAQNLRTLSAAVGPWEIEAYLAYAHPGVAQAFFTLPQPPALPGTTYAGYLSGWWNPVPVTGAASLPVVDYSFDIYLEYLLNGPTSQSQALAQTARYLGMKVNHDLLKVFAWGTIVWQVGEAIDPDLDAQAGALFAWLDTYATWSGERYGVGYNGQPVSVRVNYPPDLLDIETPDPGAVPDVPLIAPPSLDDILYQGMYTCDPVGQLACLP